MKWKVGDRVIDLETPQYGIGTIVSILGEYSEDEFNLRVDWGRSITYGRDSNDPALVLATPLLEALF